MNTTDSIIERRIRACEAISGLRLDEDAYERLFTLIKWGASVTPEEGFISVVLILE